MKNLLGLILSRLLASVPLTFHRDNPGGKWLQYKREDNEYDKKNRFGTPGRMGPCTGSFNRPVLIPVSVMAKVPGMRNEQTNVRPESLSYLVTTMEKTNMLPFENGNQYVPFMMIDQEGYPWINEGNHRIMAAAKLGWKYIPVEVRYFTGGEDNANRLGPKQLEAYDQEAQSEGYSTGNSFQGKLELNIT